MVSFKQVLSFLTRYDGAKCRQISVMFGYMIFLKELQLIGKTLDFFHYFKLYITTLSRDQQGCF
jgi:hypothetical protein